MFLPWPKGIPAASPSLCWHLDPVTADRAEEVSWWLLHPGQIPQDQAEARGRESNSPRLLPRLLQRQIEGFHLYYCQDLALLASSEIHSPGQRREWGEGRRCKPDNEKQPQ